MFKSKRVFGDHNHIRDTKRGETVHHNKEFAFPCMWDEKLLEGAKQVSGII